MKPSDERLSEVLSLVHREVKPALGCTEPIAVALAVAKAVEILSQKETSCTASCPLWRRFADFKIEVSVSGNILKNGMGVGIPGTGMVGLPIAAALGAVCGDSSKGLEVLSGMVEDDVKRAKELLQRGDVTIRLSETEHLLYVKADVSMCEERAVAEFSPIASVTIEDDHDRIARASFADQILIDSESGAAASDRAISDYGLTVREIYDIATTAPYEAISFILDDRRYNMALAKEGLSSPYGLSVGRTISGNEKIFGENFLSRAMSLTAAASDARMAGCTLPAMSNSGSGNQGITVSVPVIAYATECGASDEALARALLLSNLIAIHIKGYLGKLSALCGCVVASTGSACGIAMLCGGGYEEICAAIKNMAGNITGMVCDGAKAGCAMKVASGVSSAVQSAMLSLGGRCACKTDGIVEDDIEKTIRNIGSIGSRGMRETDSMILDIMLCK